GTLFDIDIASRDANVTGAQLALFNDQSRSGVTVQLPAIVFDSASLAAAQLKEPVASGSRLLWIGAPISYAQLESIVVRDGDAMRCHSFAVRAMDYDGNALRSNAPASSSPAPQPEAYLVLPARYDHRVFAKYPVALAAAATGGCVELLMHLRDDGTTDKVDLIRSAGAASLDQAAIDAATSSAYRFAMKDGARQTEYYDARTCFEPKP
ncbi:MAG: TonB family protein, partial [Candidatus Eremiobacteraeota bacterium]|nr:TonB family protein [Candidatus Eremiobacteraeota bacterium]